MPYPSTPSKQATHENALPPNQGWPAHRLGGLEPFSTPLDTLCCTPMNLLLLLTPRKEIRTSQIKNNIES
jgi:hypothetical protein